MKQSRLRVKQVSLKYANAFVITHHRHHGKVQGHKFSIACLERITGNTLGVAIVGRPVSRRLDDGDTLEVTRLAVVDGARNVCSFLYGASARIATALGYQKIITYILQSELGTSLKASGWTMEADTAGGKSWNSSGKAVRTNVVVDLFGTTKKYPDELKQRWSKTLYIDRIKSNLSELPNS